MPMSQNTSSPATVTRWTRASRAPFQRLAIDLVEYKTASNGCKYVMSAFDHLTRFSSFSPQSRTRVRRLPHVHVRTACFPFSEYPKFLHSVDQGRDLKPNLSKSFNLPLGKENMHYAIQDARATQS